MEHKNLLNPYTANSKKRACTRKAETKDKVNALNTKIAEQCDRAIAKDQAREDQKQRRAGYKQARLNKKEV